MNNANSYVYKKTKSRLEFHVIIQSPEINNLSKVDKNHWAIQATKIIRKDIFDGNPSPYDGLLPKDYYYPMEQ